MSAEPVTENEERAAIIVSTIIYLSLILYIGYSPSTGTSLVLGRGVITLAVGISLLSLAIKIPKHFLARHKNKKYSAINFLRPLAITVIGVLLVLNNREKENMAINFLENQAEIANSMCNATGKCPESLEGWVKFDSRYRYEYRDRNNIVFTMFYRAEADIFNINITYGPDLGYRLNGGVNRPVSKGWRSAP